MIFSGKDDDSQDFFDGPDIEVPDKDALQPQYSPDDPKYWEQDESPWDHLMPRRKRVPTWVWLVLALVVVLLCVGGYLRYFAPCVEEASQYGYVDQVEIRGTIFKTYEGVLIPYKEITDTTRIYSRDFVFSATSRPLFEQLQGMQRSGIPVRVEYKRYHATLPWRGASRIVVTRVDTADADKILPPEFAPRH